jgi:hypothetical protein
LPLPVLEKKPGLDALIDVIAPIALDGRGLGRCGAGGHADDAARGSKPFAIEGLNESGGHWETPLPGSATASFRPGCNWPTGPALSTRSSFPSLS